MLNEKGLVLKPQNFQEVYDNLENPPIIVNNLSTDTIEDERFLESLTVTTCSTTDLLENKPSCLCQNTIRLIMLVFDVKYVTQSSLHQSFVKLSLTYG